MVSTKKITAGIARPAAFLDRDGVLNEDNGFVHRPDQLVWLDGAPAAVRALNEAGYYVIVITNQAGIARGYYDETALHQFHEHMQDMLIAQGAHIDAFYYCPHHPDGVIKKWAVECNCRKPKTGLIEQALRDRNINLNQSFLIGDRDTDLAAGAALNIRSIKFDARQCTLLDLICREIGARAF
jgi:D-glycero-D-manno-heptose 1,7-bisphosphate phosphatase